MEKSRRRIRTPHPLILIMLAIAVTAMVIVQSVKRDQQDKQAQKCIYNQTIPVQEYGTFDIVCVMKGSIIVPERAFPTEQYD
jgi:uncharacterized membrane protein